MQIRKIVPSMLLLATLCTFPAYAETSPVVGPGVEAAAEVEVGPGVGGQEVTAPEHSDKIPFYSFDGKWERAAQSFIRDLGNGDQHIPTPKIGDASKFLNFAQVHTLTEWPKGITYSVYSDHLTYHMNDLEATREWGRRETEAEALLEQYVEGIEPTLEGAKQLYQKMASEISYAYDQDGKPDRDYCEVDVVLKNKKGICEGYARLYHNALKKVGIENYYVSGHVNNEKRGAHAWNAVVVDDKVYTVDSCWGAVDQNRCFVEDATLSMNGTFTPEVVY